ncbi:MAG TPA: hypothetical protein VE935_20540 [Burkholderiales bacterium]|jgi:hypothetical protein|nr:hypothetical protein [Burkholderiales bacterium]
MSAFIQAARTASPYLAIAMLLPGGLLIAPLLWLFRRSTRNRTRAGITPPARAGGG